MATVACGPYIGVDATGFWVSLAVFLLLKPLAYYGFIQAFRFRVSRPIPMTFRQAVRLTVARAGLGILFFAIGAAVVVASRSTTVLAWSWLYLYLGRAIAWFVVGNWGAVLRGRRLVGWVISGTLINAAFDLAVLSGALEIWVFQAGILLGIGAFIAALHFVGQRASLKARFSNDPFCVKCEYNLTGNLSGRCPECGTPIAVDGEARVVRSV